MSTNFKVFNPNLTNSLNDSDYNSNTQRSNGLQDGIAQTALHNKLFAQTSMMASAIAEAMSNAGETVTDTNYANLVTSVESVLINPSAALPTKYMAGPPPTYNSASSIILPAGLIARNSTDADDIVVSTPLTVSLASSGANGLDTGAEASDTWYYVYLIKKSSDGTVAGLLSVTNEAASGSVTLPAGYDLKRQLPIAVRNDGSSNILPFKVSFGWPAKPTVLLPEPVTYYTGSSFPAGTCNIISAGRSGTWATVSAAAFVPPVSRQAYLSVLVSEYGTYRFRETGTSTAYHSFGDPNTGVLGFNAAPVLVNASQSLDYIKDTGSVASALYADVVGFVVTEI